MQASLPIAGKFRWIARRRNKALFNKTAAATRAVFPQELKTLVVLLVPTSGTPVYVSPEIADQLTKNTAAVKKAVKSLAGDMMTRNWAGLANRHYELAGADVNLIALRDNLPGIYYSGYTKKMWRIFVLDHELGHHILKNGFSTAESNVSRQEAESAADTYAMLRHIQRFGKNTKYSQDYGKRRNSSIILYEDTEHHTTASVQRAVQVSQEMDISGLSLKETAALAEKIANETRLDYKTLWKILTAFKPVSDACKASIGSKHEISEKFRAGDKKAYTLFCRETLAVMEKYKDDPEIFNVGKNFLTGFPPIRKFMEKEAKTNAYWKDALCLIDGRPAAAHKNGGLKPLRRFG